MRVEGRINAPEGRKRDASIAPCVPILSPIKPLNCNYYSIGPLPRGTHRDASFDHIGPSCAHITCFVQDRPHASPSSFEEVQ